MSPRATDKAAAWIYQGVWRVIVDLFRVPPDPPDLPAADPAAIRSFHPAYGFLRWLRLHFWILLLLIDGAIFILWVVVFANHRVAGYITLPIALFIAIVPDIIAYVAIHLRYDTTWYVLSDRSLRIRRGVWIINETTITFENIQNVKINQGPIQRLFGIKTLTVETAGGGEATTGESASSSKGVIEGVDDAEQIRDLIMTRVRRSRSAGLGDEHINRAAPSTTRRAPLSPAHISALRALRDEARALHHALAD